MNAVYYEDGWEARVQILDDTSDTKFERYKLKVVNTVVECPTIGHIEDGHVFDVEQERGTFDKFELIKA